MNTGIGATGQDEERLAFAEELEEVALQLSLSDPQVPVAAQQEQLLAEYERLAMTAEMFALSEMAAVIQWVSTAVETPAFDGLSMEGKFYGWLEMAALILREPEEVSHLALLTTELMDPAWPEPLDASLLQGLLLSLRAEPARMAGSAAGTGFDFDADPDDTAVDSMPVATGLAFAADIHPELLAAYLEETPGHVVEAARLVRLLALGAGTAEQKRQASRLVHTIKGSSGVVGVEAIAGFTHTLEDLLDVPFHTMPEGLGPTLEAAADCLEALFEHLQAGQGLPEEYADLCTSLDDWVQTLAAEVGTEDIGLSSTAPPSLATLASLLNDDEGDKNGGGDEGDEAGTDSAVAESLAPGAASSLVTLSDDRVQRLLNLTGELITSTSQTAELLQQAGRLGKQLGRQDESIRQRLEELEVDIDQQARQLVQLPPTGQKTGASTDDLDDLEMESYGGLYSTASLLTESAADSRELAHSLQQCIRQLSDELYQQQRLQRQLSEAVLATRMTAISTLVARLERIVRETCRKTGKQARITIHGQHLQVDADIVKGISDPLLHLLRNAVDHGIELPAERVASGKDEIGQITLSFARKGNHVTLRLEDDGQGMDPVKIQARALECGLLAPGEVLAEEALLRLVLQPGFSTRDEVNELSGRGVGMDVVQAAIARLRGTLHLQSQVGAGSQILIDLPQTLIATHALVVRVSGNLVAIPADSIEQLLYVSAAESRLDDEQGWQIETSRYQLPVTQLAQVLHWQAPAVSVEQAHTLMIVRSEMRTYAFYAEEILPSRDIVIKNLAPWLSHISTVQGACILANGVVAPVLDMTALLRQMDSGELQPQVNELPLSLAVNSRSTILVVDDSLSNRKSMRLMLEGMGHTVLTAIDGLDALQVLNGSQVDMILTDLEMPRMNGLEMAQAVRIWPEMKHLPVIMVTSRSTRKHRELATEAGIDAYMTKPVQAGLLQQQVDKWLGTQLNALPV